VDVLVVGLSVGGDVTPTSGGPANVTLPSIRAELGTSTEQSQWITDAYVLVGSVAPAV
jgi:hypothetical protein